MRTEFRLQYAYDAMSAGGAGGALQQSNGGGQTALCFIDRHQQRVGFVIGVSYRRVTALGQRGET